MSGCGCLCIYPSWVLTVIHQIWEVFSHCFFKYFSSLLLVLPLCICCLLNGVPHSSLALSIFFIVFSFFYSGYIICIDLSSSSLSLSSSSSDLLLSLSSESFVLVIILSTRDFRLILFIISVFPYSLYFVRIIIMPSFKSFSMASFTSLNIFVVVPLTSLSAKYNIWAPSKAVPSLSLLRGCSFGLHTA